MEKLKASLQKGRVKTQETNRVIFFFKLLKNKKCKPVNIKGLIKLTTNNYWRKKQSTRKNLQEE